MGEEIPQPLSDQLEELRASARALLKTLDGPDRERQTEELAAHFDAAEATAVRLERRIAELSDQLTQAKDELFRTQEALIIDPLTGLFNRKGFQYAAENIVHTMMASGQQDRYGVVVVDLCLFKAINETFGHAVGNLALKEAANRMRGMVREKRGDVLVRRHSPHAELIEDIESDEVLNDSLVRDGGDEYLFLIHLPHDGTEQILTSIAERIQKSVDQPFYIEVEGKEVKIPLLAAVGYAMVETIPLDSKLREKSNETAQREEKLYYLVEDETNTLHEMTLAEVKELVRDNFAVAQLTADARMYEMKKTIHEQFDKYSDAQRLAG